VTERRAAPRLAEVPEADATGTVAALYDDIRCVTGVRTVALVYRVLAPSPETLATVWEDLAPNLADPRVRTAALALDAGRSARVTSLAPELVSVPRPETAATLASFARINRLNLVGLSALLDGVDAPASRALVASAGPDPIGDGLPMADVERLPNTTTTLLEEMSASVAGAERPIVIPSLFRYFAHDERLLRALWTALRPVVEDDSFVRGVTRLRHDATMLANAFPYRVRPLPPGEARVAVERFLRTIPSMIILGGALETAFGLEGGVDSAR